MMNIMRRDIKSILKISAKSLLMAVLLLFLLNVTPFRLILNSNQALARGVRRGSRGTIRYSKPSTRDERRELREDTADERRDFREDVDEPSDIPGERRVFREDTYDERRDFREDVRDDRYWHLGVGTRARVLPVGYSEVWECGETYYIYDGVYYKLDYVGNEVVYVVIEESDCW